MSSVLLARATRSALVFLVAGALGACGSSSGNSGSGGQNDGGGDTGGPPDGGGDAADSGDASHADGGGDADAGPGYPAFAIDVPQILKNQGTVLASPVIVTITWPADTGAATWEAFDDGIGASSYWKATTAEYGVGPATSAAADHVRMARPLPATLSYTALQNLVTVALTEAVQADAGAPEAGTGDGGASDPVWPAPTLDAKGNPQTIYSLFIPSSTAITDPGTGSPFCNFGATGYHATVSVGTLTLAYAVTLECPSMGNDGIEETAAHETVETATDPYEGTGNDGYHDFDPDHLAWNLYDGYPVELADACQNWQYAYTQLTGSFPYWVQLSWSNKAALAGHDPCVPEPAGPYHGMTLFPSEETAVSVDLSVIGAPATTSRGFDVTIGKPTTFHVGFFSDAPSAPWTIGYDFPPNLATFDTSFNPLGNGKGTVTLSKTSGQNGDEVTVTVTPTVKGEGGFQVMAITWDPPGAGAMYPSPRYLPILLVDH
jgi:hypothetical protein